jgi:ribosome-associated protein
MINEDGLFNELSFKAIRSSGAGGQHINKTSSKVELKFNILNSQFLTDIQKELLVHNLSSRLTSQGELILQCGESRSQHQNKSIVIDRFFNLLNKGLIIPEERIKTKTPKSAKIKRLSKKRKISEKKANRKPPRPDEIN